MGQLVSDFLTKVAGGISAYGKGGAGVSLKDFSSRGTTPYSKITSGIGQFAGNGGGGLPGTGNLAGFLTALGGGIDLSLGGGSPGTSFDTSLGTGGGLSVGSGSAGSIGGGGLLAALLGAKSNRKDEKQTPEQKQKEKEDFDKKIMTKPQDLLRYLLDEN